MSMQGSHHRGPTLEEADLVGPRVDPHFFLFSRLRFAPYFIAPVFGGSRGLQGFLLINFNYRPHLGSKRLFFAVPCLLNHFCDSLLMCFCQALLPDLGHLLLGRAFHLVGAPIDHEFTDQLGGGF